MCDVWQKFIEYCTEAAKPSGSEYVENFFNYECSQITLIEFVQCPTPRLTWHDSMLQNYAQPFKSAKRRYCKISAIQQISHFNFFIKRVYNWLILPAYNFTFDLDFTIMFYTICPGTRLKIAHGTRVDEIRFHLGMPDLSMSYIDLITSEDTRVLVPIITDRRHALLLRKH